MFCWLHTVLHSDEVTYKNDVIARAQLEGDDSLVTIKRPQLGGLLRQARAWSKDKWTGLSQADVQELHQTMRLFPDREGTHDFASQLGPSGL